MICTIKRADIAAMASVMMLACGSRKGTEQVDVKDMVKVAAIDSVEIAEVINPAVMLVADGRLIVGSFNTDTVFYSYSLPELAPDSRGVAIGQGPGDIYNPMVMGAQLSPDGLVALPYGGRGGMALVDPSTLELTEKMTFPIPADWIFVQNVVWIAPGKYLEQKGNLPLSWAMVGPAGEVVSEAEPTIPDALAAKAGRDLSADMIVRTAVGVASADNGRWAVCYRVFPQIEVFGADGKLIKRELLDLDYDMKIACFVNAKSDSKGFYVNYQSPGGKEYGSAILHFDWDGNLVNAYPVEQKIGAFAVDSHKTGRVYYTTMAGAERIYSFEMSN